MSLELDKNLEIPKFEAIPNGDRWILKCSCGYTNTMIRIIPPGIIPPPKQCPSCGRSEITPT